jgi:hypothetical protein
MIGNRENENTFFFRKLTTLKNKKQKISLGVAGWLDGC